MHMCFRFATIVSFHEENSVHSVLLTAILISGCYAVSIQSESQSSHLKKNIENNITIDDTNENSELLNTDRDSDNNFLIAISDWQGGAAGAASISVDDSCTSCREKLKSYGLKGTYYLSYTDKFSQDDWNMWRSIYEEGHEIGGHTTNHIQYINDEALLRRELETNIEHIIKNLGIAEVELSSFAWPCGETNPKYEKIASEYYVSARGYHINMLEDKNPQDFMELKCLNTPHYHDPEYEPPDYIQKADEAESLGKWVHYVFHNHCKDDGAIGYLSEKNLWVAPVGTVVEYIKERQNSQITNIIKTDSGISFSLVCELDKKRFNTPITLEVFASPNDVRAVLVDERLRKFKKGLNSILFDVQPVGKNDISIFLGNTLPDNIANRMKIDKAFNRISQKPVLAGTNGIVTNIWISDWKKLDRLKDHRISYLLVDIGDTKENGEIETPKEQIEGFISLIESYEKQNNYNFIIIPYSEINTYHYNVLDNNFKENYINECIKLISLGFDGIYVDIEPVRLGMEDEYLALLGDLYKRCPKEALIGIYAGYIYKPKPSGHRKSEWEWPLVFLEKVAVYGDFICIPSYDLQKSGELEYMNSLGAEIEILCSKRLNCGLVFMIPTHEKEPEIIENALKSYKKGMQNCPYNQFIGVCIFAEWTTNTNEWSIFESYMNK